MGRGLDWRFTKEDMRREPGISTFNEGKLQLATITRQREKCGNDEFEYTGKQIRLADEGQTKFFMCTRCGDTITEYQPYNLSYCCVIFGFTGLFTNVVMFTLLSFLFQVSALFVEFPE